MRLQWGGGGGVSRTELTLGTDINIQKKISYESTPKRKTLNNQQINQYVGMRAH